MKATGQPRKTGAQGETMADTPPTITITPRIKGTLLLRVAGTEDLIELGEVTFETTLAVVNITAPGVGYQANDEFLR